MFKVPSGWKCILFQHENNQPYIFLLDENHDMADVISDNLEIAYELIADYGVGLVGVEDYASRIDPYKGDVCHPRHHSTAELPYAHYIGTETRFAKGIQNHGAIVVGVDSEGLKCEIEMTCKSIDDVSNHPANVLRSENFVMSLFQERQYRGLECNVLINCGADHNQHILDFVKGKRSRPKDWPEGSYINLRSPKFL